jgi:Skp family chaperone for outer membrane proteins
LSQTFDEKVVGVRQDQANKQSDLQQRQRDAERALLETIAPILYEIVRDRGASVLIDRRNIILDLSSVDITDDAIVKLNEQIGDGTKASEPAKIAQ